MRWTTVRVSVVALSEKSAEVPASKKIRIILLQNFFCGLNEFRQLHEQGGKCRLHGIPNHIQVDVKVAVCKSIANNLFRAVATLIARPQSAQLLSNRY